MAHTVEVAPLQSVFIDDDNLFIFRRIVINDQIYRQGFILRARAYLEYLARAYFSGQPMAGYAHLRMAVYDGDRLVRAVDTGAEALQPVFIRTRYFPDPFGFLSAALTTDREVSKSGSPITKNGIRAVRPWLLSCSNISR